MFGNMNALNPMWFDGKLDIRGEMIQSSIETKNLHILSDDQPTFYRASDHASCHIYLAMITDTCPTEYNWNLLDDFHGSVN